MIGVGSISGIYLKNLTEMFKEVEIYGVYDLFRDRAEKAQEEYGIAKVYDSLDEIFDDPEVEIVLNLTRPYEHFDVTSRALKAGKHVYTEKPLGATFEEGVALAKLAKETGLMLGGAPDTFLGSGIQTCRHIIDSDMIGEPIGSACFMICHGHESWHPDPAFYYKHGGGPMMDMGPYYVTALVNLMGGVSGVTGVSKSMFDKRVITSEPKYGEVVDVEVPTYVTGTLHFDSGAVGTIFTTFDVHYNQQARFEVYGTKGTLIVPDPNTFGGDIKLYRPEDGEFKDMPLLFDYKENSRGLGLADMAKAIRTGRPMRAGFDLALHVLEIISSFDKSSDAKAYLPLTTQYKVAPPMKNNPMSGILD